MIGANSPQANGRIERVFGMLQDWMAKELRLAESRRWPQGTPAAWVYHPL
jgi:hypothetical protein